jgi:hypothetical protein
MPGGRPPIRSRMLLARKHDDAPCSWHDNAPCSKHDRSIAQRRHSACIAHPLAAMQFTDILFVALLRRRFSPGCRLLQYFRGARVRPCGRSVILSASFVARFAVARKTTSRDSPGWRHADDLSYARVRVWRALRSLVDLVEGFPMAEVLVETPRPARGRESLWSELIHKEDWWSIWIGVGLIAVAVGLLAAGASIKWPRWPANCGRTACALRRCS